MKPLNTLTKLATLTLVTLGMNLAVATDTKTAEIKKDEVKKVEVKKDESKKDETKKTEVKPVVADDAKLLEDAKAVFEPLPSVKSKLDEVKANEAMVKLGQTLFFDPRLSKGGTVSCNSCHNLATYGVDNLPTSQGWMAHFGGRNSPTVLNSSLFFAQFWDGRAKDVEEQAGGPLLNPVEMALPNKETAENIIRSIPGYQELFDKAFGKAKKPGQNITFKNITHSIAAFERTLLTPSRFDKFLKGDLNALTKEEKVGLRKFIDVGCVQCHFGVGLGGNNFQKFGLIQGPYWKFTGSKKPDEGRFEVTKAESDKYLFKVPGLRNIDHTYPYFHDGSVWSLDKAVEIMVQAQLGKKLPPQEINEIVTFLKSLTGTIDPKARELPLLPKSGPKTPRPDNTK